MKLAFEVASISYCPDLTDPKGKSVPIAVLAIGKVSRESVWVAAAACIDAKRLGLDPLSAAMLNDVPHLIRSHVDAALINIGPDANPRDVLAALHESLKTSIYVSDIADATEVDVRTTKAAAERVLAEANRRLIRQVKAVPAAKAGKRRELVPSELIEPMPEHVFWQPRVSDSNAAPAG